jgi:hypothetical protein
MSTRGVNVRGSERYPVRIPAQLLNWETTNRNCVITDFSANGLRVELARRPVMAPGLMSWLARGVAVSVGFVLPGVGRRVRADADVAHVSAEGERVCFGLHVPVSDPTVIEALMASVRRSGPSAAPSTTSPGMRPSAPGRGSSVSPADAVPPPGTLAQLCERYFAKVRDQLMQRFARDPDDSDAFLALVVVHNSQQQLRALLLRAGEPAPVVLREEFRQALDELGLAEGVRALMLDTFDELFAPLTGAPRRPV